MITLNDIQAAAGRIAGEIRTTPLLEVTLAKEKVSNAELVLKLELLQVTGSFKARGVANILRATPKHQLEHGIVTASGGNHGLAVARAGTLAGVPAIIFLPKNVSPAKIEKLKLWGAETIITGETWNQSNEAAKSYSEETGGCYFHPFADPLVVAGQGTVGLEILEQDPTIDTLLVAIGGGGLITGVASAAKAIKPSVNIIGVEALGSPTLKRSVEAGRSITIDKLTTSVATMACARTDDRIIESVARNVDDIVLVDDEEMLHAAHWLWFEFGLAADLSGAAAIAALQSGRIKIESNRRACAIVCGAGPDALGSK